VLLFALLTVVLTFAMGFVLPTAGVVAGSAAVGLAGVVAGWVLLRQDGWESGALGLVPDTRAVAETGSGLVLGVLVACTAMGLMALAGGLDWGPDGAEWSIAAWAAEGVRSLVWLALPAAAEEVLLRGYVLGATARVLGPVWALWITAVVFGLLHGGNPGVGGLGLVGVTVAGLFLGALVLRTGSLWPAIGVHRGWNWAQAFLADLPVSGLEVADVPGFDGVAAGPAWLSGGAFGVEASVVAVVVVSAAAWAVWRWRPALPASGRPAPLWTEANVT
jgi:membrane protease YdiL (CAAX protease family)